VARIAAAYASSILSSSDSESFGNVTRKPWRQPAMLCAHATRPAARWWCPIKPVSWPLPTNAQAFAAISRSLAQDGALRAHGNAARARALTFSWERRWRGCWAIIAPCCLGPYNVKIVTFANSIRPPAAGAALHQPEAALAGKFGHEADIIAPGAETRMEPAHGGTIAWIKSPHLPFDRNYRMFWNHQQVWRTLDRLAAGSGGGSSPWRGGWLAARWSGKAVKVFSCMPIRWRSIRRLFWAGCSDRSGSTSCSFFWRYLNRLNSNYDAAIVNQIRRCAERFAGFGLEISRLRVFRSGAQQFSPSFTMPPARREMLATSPVAPTHRC